MSVCKLKLEKLMTLPKIDFVNGHKTSEYHHSFIILIAHLIVCLSLLYISIRKGERNRDIVHTVPLYDRVTFCPLLQPDHCCLTFSGSFISPTHTQTVMEL